VRLETVLVGGRRMVSREALERFVAEVTAAADGGQQPVRSSRRRRRDMAAAAEELRAAGI
jgi:hypothetical protein